MVKFRKMLYEVYVIDSLVLVTYQSKMVSVVGVTFILTYFVLFVFVNIIFLLKCIELFSHLFRNQVVFNSVMVDYI